MKKQTRLTANELMDIVAINVREMNDMDLSDKNLKNAMKRASVTCVCAKTAIQIANYDYRSINHKKVLPGKNVEPRKLNKREAKLL